MSIASAPAQHLSAQPSPLRTDAACPFRPALLSLGTAVPDMCQSQEDIEHEMARIWNLQGTSLARWRRIVAGSQIATRHGILPPAHVVGLSTAQRMRAYEQYAPSLAFQAAEEALTAARIHPSQVTELIIVSCTGFSAPGVDAHLVEMLGLPNTVRRTLVGFMGCFGAINGLRAAVGACAANAQARPVALVVSVELCSLHMRADPDPQNQVASALFADGAAAAVVACDVERTTESTCPAPLAQQTSHHFGLGRLTTGASLLLQRGRDWMTWRITDAGFAMSLSREVPVALRQALRDFVQHAAPSWPRSFIVHPGGPGVIDAAEAALNLQGDNSLSASRAVLARYGNMSSATVLFVLQEALRCGSELPAMLLAFGPGLTIESIDLIS